MPETMKELNQQIIDELNQQIIDELNQQIFDEHAAYMREKSRADGMPKKLSKYIELELEGIEDIIAWMTDKLTVEAIQERVTRIRNFLSEQH